MKFIIDQKSYYEVEKKDNKLYFSNKKKEIEIHFAKEPIMYYFNQTVFRYPGRIPYYDIKKFIISFQILGLDQEVEIQGNPEEYDEIQTLLTTLFEYENTPVLSLDETNIEEIKILCFGEETRTAIDMGVEITYKDKEREYFLYKEHPLMDLSLKKVVNLEANTPILTTDLPSYDWLTIIYYSVPIVFLFIAFFVLFPILEGWIVFVLYSLVVIIAPALITGLVWRQRSSSYAKYMVWLNNDLIKKDKAEAKKTYIKNVSLLLLLIIIVNLLFMIL